MVHCRQGTWEAPTHILASSRGRHLHYKQSTGTQGHSGGRAWCVFFYGAVLRLALLTMLVKVSESEAYWYPDGSARNFGL